MLSLLRRNEMPRLKFIFVQHLLLFLFSISGRFHILAVIMYERTQ
jgi:hypothetical protein